MQDEGYYDILVQILNLLQSNDSENVWGVIGPGDDPSVADLIAPISENSGLITVRLISHRNLYFNLSPGLYTKKLLCIH